MKLVVAAVGQRMPGWVEAGWNEYARRFPSHLTLELVEVPVAGRSGSSRDNAIEAERLLARAPQRASRIAMHGSQKAWSTEHLADRLAHWQMLGDPVWFFIGGANGLTPEVLATCTERWSLGPAVFPHMLVRVIVAEQLYRASTILSGHPYHRA